MISCPEGVLIETSTGVVPFDLLYPAHMDAAITIASLLSVWGISVIGPGKFFTLIIVSVAGL